MVEVAFKTARLTSDADACLALLQACGVNVKDAAVTALVIRPHPRDGDGAGVIVGGGELHVGLLMADADGGALLVRQEDLLVLVVPPNLPDSVTHRRGDVAGQLEGATRLCTQTGRSYDLT